MVSGHSVVLPYVLPMSTWLCIMYIQLSAQYFYFKIPKQVNIEQNHRKQTKKHPDFYQYPLHFIDRPHQKFQTYLCSSMVPRRKIEARVRNASCLKVFQCLITWHEWNGDINAIVSVHGGYEISIYIYINIYTYSWLFAINNDTLRIYIYIDSLNDGTSTDIGKYINIFLDPKMDPRMQNNALPEET